MKHPQENDVKVEHDEKMLSGEPVDPREDTGVLSRMKIEEVDEREIPTWPVHMEVRLKAASSMAFPTVKEIVRKYMSSWAKEVLYLPSVVTGWQTQKQLLMHVDLIRVTESTFPGTQIPFSQTELDIHVYQPNDNEFEEDFATSVNGKAEESVMAANVCDLPRKSWDDLWDTLVYPDDLKSKLLNYIYATQIFSDRDVNFNVISWNRIVLLHGPPGTGKTSLCRALAQKLSIRLSEQYQVTKIVEINSHSLFSRWFSESGKLVQKLFASVTEMVEEEGTFVVLLIGKSAWPANSDEVESLTSARANAVSGNEPSDALRVVNALLTQLDKLKHRKNVLVVTTSNLVNAIDTAFVDRADIVQYVGLPAREGVYSILHSCIEELVRAGIVSPVTLESPQFFTSAAGRALSRYKSQRDLAASRRLWELAELCQGMSGRSLRRLPVLAHARHIGISVAGAKASEVETWLAAMEKVATDETGSRAVLNGLSA